MKKSKLNMGLLGLTMAAVTACAPQTEPDNGSVYDNSDRQNNSQNNGGYTYTEPNNDPLKNCTVAIDPVYISRSYIKNDTDEIVYDEILETTKGYYCGGGYENVFSVPTQAGQIIHVWHNKGNCSDRRYPYTEILPYTDDTENKRSLNVCVTFPAVENCTY